MGNRNIFNNMSNYLILDLLALLPTFLLSFHKKIEFYKKWKALLPAIILTAVFFIGWDIIFTVKAVWGFNPVQVCGRYFFNLPIEELLFFFVVPYSSIFTYEVIKNFNLNRLPEFLSKSVSLLLIILMGVFAFGFSDRLYTFYVCLLTAVLLIFFEFILKFSWMNRFYVAFAILLVPFIIMNGLLTSSLMGSVVVWYNPAHIMGPRLFTIPIEDVFYGLSLILINIALYEFFLMKKESPGL